MMMAPDRPSFRWSSVTAEEVQVSLVPGSTLVAKACGRQVGEMMFDLNLSRSVYGEAIGPDAVSIGYIGVASQAQRRGIGGMLLSHLHQHILPPETRRILFWGITSQGTLALLRRSLGEVVPCRLTSGTLTILDDDAWERLPLSSPAGKTGRIQRDAPKVNGYVDVKPL